MARNQPVFRVLLGVMCLLGFAASISAEPVTFSYTGPAVAIPDLNLTGVNIPIVVSGVGTMLDVNVRFDTAGACDGTPGNTNAAVDHTFIGDLVFKLTSPSGTTREFFKRRGQERRNICATLIDDESGAANVSSITNSPGNPLLGTFTSEAIGSLSAFAGENADGIWTLNVVDAGAIDDGSLRRFSLIFEPVPCQVFGCPANLTVGTGPGECSRSVSFPGPAGIGCGASTCSAASGSVFPLGLTKVDCQSGVGNKSCSFNVTVVDTEPPALQCPGSLFIPTASTVGKIVDYDVSATDNCPGVSAPQCTHGSGGIFPFGPTPVSCSIIDGSGASSTCDFTVNVLGGVSVDILAGEAPTCVGGPKLRGGKLVLKQVGEFAAEQSIELTGRVKFKRAVASLVNGRVNGAQLRLFDVGNSSATLYEFSERNAAIPPGDVGASTACGAADGWSKANAYRNQSNKIERQTCFEESANGLQSLKLSTPDATGFSTFRLKTTKSRLLQSDLTGPFGVTVVFGSNVQGAAGQCFTASYKPRRCTRRGTTLTCLN